MSQINLEQFRSVIRAEKFVSYSAFVDHLYDLNEKTMVFNWNHQQALAKTTNLVPFSWKEIGWANAKIILYIDRAVQLFEHYNQYRTGVNTSSHIKQGVEGLLESFTEVLSQLETFEISYHYTNAVALAQPVLNELHKIKQLGSN